MCSSDLEHVRYHSGLPDYLFTADKLEINKDASRRVEFKFRLRDEDMVDEMMKILNEVQ